LIALVTAPAMAAPKVIVDVTNIPRPAASPPLEPALKASGEKLFNVRCAMCHGPTGAGDGPVAASMTPKPRRFSDRFWQLSIDDDALKAVILSGGSARKLSPLMPAHPDLKDKPELDALIKYLRELKSANGTVLVRVENATTKKSITADANDTATAKAQLEVPAGKYTVVVESAPGVQLCATTAVVADNDVSVSCAGGAK
jgi:mono/diheme cytochrome c family protein